MGADRSGNVEQDPVHFPRPVTRYWTETHPEAFSKGTSDFARYYGMLSTGLQTAYVNGFAYNQLRRCPTRRFPQRFARAEEVSRGSSGVSSCASGTRRASRPRSRSTARSRRSIRTSLSDEELAAYLTPLPRPPRRDDHPAHALHRRRR